MMKREIGMRHKRTYRSIGNASKKIRYKLCTEIYMTYKVNNDIIE